jgi:hypothetical protein
VPREPPEERTCCTLSLRWNPFDLVFSKVSFEAELAVVGPLSIEVAPRYIFGIPDEGQDSITAKGYGVDGKLGYYFSGHALRGFFLKAVAQYEHYSLTGTTSGNNNTLSFSETTVGGLIGSQTVFGRNGGFTLTGAIGVGYTLSAKNYEFEVSDTPVNPAIQCKQPDGPIHTVYTACVDRPSINLIGQLSIGYTF